MNHGLKNITINKLIKVFDKYDRIEKVILYGSRAKGNFRKGSDIDLALSGEDLDLSYISRLKTDIDDLLLPYIVDIRVYHTITSDDLIDHINRVGIEIYSRTNYPVN